MHLLPVYLGSPFIVANSGQWLVMKQYLRKPSLYPAELRDRIDLQNFVAVYFGSFFVPYPLFAISHPTR
jgi:hypothetical protein